MERFCRECSAPLTGRTDKQFCSDSCRTAFHNRLYRTQNSGTTRVNTVLRRNRRLLAAIYAAGLDCISLKDSRMEGYDSRFYTAVERRLLRSAVYHCYEYSYKMKGERLYNLKRIT